MPPKGLQNFVTGKNDPSSFSQPPAPQTDRRAQTKGMKFSPGPRKSSKSSSSGHQHSTSTAPPAVPAYTTHPITDRNYVPNHQNSLYEKAGNVKKSPFDDTATDLDLTSEFDGTEPHDRHAPEYDGFNHASRQESDEYHEDGTEDGTHAQNDAHQAEGYDENSHRIQKLAHHGRRSPKPDNNQMGPPQNPVSFSRFTGSQQGQKALPQDDVAIAPSKPRQVPMMGGRSEEDPRGQRNLRQHDDFEISQQANRRKQEVDKQNVLDGSDVDELESPIDDPENASEEYHWPSGIDQTPYYTEEQLEKMEYEVLKKEKWDGDLPRKRSRESNDNLGEAPLKERLMELMDKEAVVEDGSASPDVQAAILKMQFNFFKSIPIEEWESCGEILIGRMAEIMKQMTAARQAKRKLVADFEKKIEKREILVRGKSQHIEAEFKEMKENGLGLLRGKSS